MKTEIYYFSGTGNSLFIAEELKKRIIGAKLIPILKVLKSGKHKTDADIVGLVFPIYATTFPEEVEQFLEILEYNSNAYIFAVSSRKCRPQVFNSIDKILSGKGGMLSGARSISMPQNYIPVFTTEASENIKRQDDEMAHILDEFAPFILLKKKSIEEAKKLPVPIAIMYLIVRFSSFLNRKTLYFNLANRFYTNDKCIGCGICEKVCLSERIALHGGKPEWDAAITCRHCLACIHYCPYEAIQIKNARTEKSGRYHHTGISAEDIANQR